MAATPTGLAATAVSPTTVNTSWSAVSGATYDLEENGVVVATAHASTSLSRPGRAPSTDYDYRVRSRVLDAVPALPGWLRTSSNTGLAAAGLVEGDLTAYTYTAPITTALTGRVIDVGSGQVVVTTGGSLTNCIVRGSGNRLLCLAGSNVSITNVNVVDTGTGSSELIVVYVGSYDGGWGGGGYVKGLQMKSVLITGGTLGLQHDGEDATDTSVLDEVYVTALNNGGLPAHADGFTRRSGLGPLLIKNSRFDVYHDATTAAFFLQPTYSAVGKITVQTSHFEGNNHPITLETCQDVTFTNNRTLAVTEGNDVLIDPLQGANTNLVMTDTFKYANDPGNDYRGAAV